MLEPNLVDWNEINLNCADFYLNRSSFVVYRANKMSDYIFPSILETLDLTDYNAHAHMIVIRNNLDWISPLGKNEKFLQYLNRTDYNKSNFKWSHIFRDVYHKLFKLSPDSFFE